MWTKRRTDGRTDRRTDTQKVYRETADTTQLIVVFRNFANAT